MKFIVIGGVILLILTIAKGIFSSALVFLPLGGSSVSEMGIVYGLAVAAATISELWKG